MAETGRPEIINEDALNAIRAAASPAYQAAVPIATRGNLMDVGNPILSYEPLANEFLNAIVNKIVMQIVQRRTWTNPLGILKRGTMPLGEDIEDIHVNPAQSEDYDGTEVGMADILKMHRPDVATVYYRLNRKDKYPVTINNQQLRAGFTTWGKLDDLISVIVESLYTGNTIDEFKYTKQLVSDTLAGGRLRSVVVPYPATEPTGKAFMKELRTLASMFSFPSANYNNYLLINPTGNPRTTWCDIDDLIIIIRADVASSVGVEVLSSLFNVEYADYVARQILVDNFGDDNTLAVLADRKAFVIYEQLREFATFFNASSLGWQYYYHAWDLFAFSPFYNAVALVQAAPTPPTP